MFMGFSTLRGDSGPLGLARGWQARSFKSQSITAALQKLDMYGIFIIIAFRDATFSALAGIPFFFRLKGNFLAFPLQRNPPALGSASSRPTACLTASLCQASSHTLTQFYVSKDRRSLCLNTVLLLPKHHHCRFCAMDYLVLIARQPKL